ncbi:MAG TPA: hypothetical protein PLF22_01350 [Pseudomonadales bacterium]|nr:hypothetical protein [Pseudomonadales bacterium]
MRTFAKTFSLLVLLYCLAPAAHANTAVAIAAGDSHNCVLTSAGAVQCWGSNVAGQLGDGTTNQRNTPVAVSGLTSGVTAIAAGKNHTCALTSAGAVKCWGDNNYGDLGNNADSQSDTPVAVLGLTSGVMAIAAGEDYTCALTSTGAVKCWGDNFHGQLGDNTTITRFTPVAVNGLSSGVTAIAAGFNHACALISTGAVKCWGWNSYGQLGDNTTTQRNTPVAVSGLTSGVIAIAAGYQHTCALTSAGAVQCWGWNGNGQLGNNSYTTRYTPVAVSGLTSGVTAIAVGDVHTCALTSAGTVKCWGYNGYGQLGDGTTTTNRLTPVAVSGLTSGVTAIAAGYQHICALINTGGVTCWGNNGSGQLGDGTVLTSYKPTSGVVGFDDLDGDSVAGTADALPMDAAASVDTDGDGTPDNWNAGCNTTCQTNSGLGLDDFPYNPAASTDTDHDGKPDSWNANCDVSCQNNSGLVLDDDNDDDGIPNALDPQLNWVPLTVNGTYKGSSIRERTSKQ